ncbi:MAG: hypothetical protein HQ506_02440 [Candidatus Marinimicrobia bacterium]|nr:hypothetical protein [Candidatus Neomarinimicrobiota bacterium]
MKIRRSARTIIATVLLLTAFTSFTVWHNKAPGKLSEQAQQVSIAELGFKNPGLNLLTDNLNSVNSALGFYVIGPDPQNAWPTCLYRASYSDPLAGFRRVSSGEVLIRYRSIEDFLFIVNEAERKTPGALSGLTFHGFRTIPEPSLSISYRLFFSLIIGGVGVMMVKFYNRTK